MPKMLTLRLTAFGISVNALHGQSLTMLYGSLKPMLSVPLVTTTYSMPFDSVEFSSLQSVFSNLYFTFPQFIANFHNVYVSNA